MGGPEKLNDSTAVLIPAGDLVISKIDSTVYHPWPSPKGVYDYVYLSFSADLKWENNALNIDTLRATPFLSKPKKKK
jgi:hypothetical protein